MNSRLSKILVSSIGINSSYDITMAYASGKIERGIIIVETDKDLLDVKSRRLGKTESMPIPYALSKLDYFDIDKPTKSRKGSYSQPKNYKRKKAKNGRTKKRRK
ncbi:MAG: hypothetical protein V4549_07635 [Bacteroidota bacterium]